MYLIREGAKILLPQDQFYIVENYLMTTKSIRLSTSEKSSVLSILKSAPNPGKALQLLEEQINFSIAIESIIDDVLNIKLSEDVILQFEEAYNKPQEILQICLSIMHYSPSIVTKLFDALHIFNQFEKNITNVEAIYAYAINQLLKSCSFDQLEAIIRAVVEYVSIEEADDSDSGWGLSEDNTEIQGFPAIEATVKNLLVEAIGRVEDFDLDGISMMKSILYQVRTILVDLQYFILSEHELRKIKLLESSYVHKIWGIQVCSWDLCLG